MKISQVSLKNFKRFTDLSIVDIPKSAKLVILVGPNGCGKSSLFDGFNQWYRAPLWGWDLQDEYRHKYYGISGLPAGKVDVKFHDFVPDGDRERTMYFRTAYRNESDFSVQSIDNRIASLQPYRISRMIDPDVTVSTNLQRVSLNILKDIRPENKEVTVGDLLTRTWGKLQDSLDRIFDGNLRIVGVDNPVRDQGTTLQFAKGDAKSYLYMNLSAGEKAVVDLIFDLIVNVKDYKNTVFSIDEPEIHIHTDIQGKVLHEMCKIIPDKCQLWVATHSLGVMQAAIKMENDKPGSVACLDFSGHDFDTEVVMRPTPITRGLIEKFTSIALGSIEYFSLITAKFIVVCEGNLGTEKSIDHHVYSRIFGSAYDDMEFVPAGGGCSEVKRLVDVLSALLKGISTPKGKSPHVVGIIDRDNLTERECQELRERHIFPLPEGKRSIESCLLDDEIVRILGQQSGVLEPVILDCLSQIHSQLSGNSDQEKPKNDYKFARQDIHRIITRCLGLANVGSDSTALLRDIMAPLITPETKVYQEMKQEIILPIRKSVPENTDE